MFGQAEHSKFIDLSAWVQPTCRILLRLPLAAVLASSNNHCILPTVITPRPPRPSHRVQTIARQERNLHSLWPAFWLYSHGWLLWAFTAQLIYAMAAGVDSINCGGHSDLLCGTEKNTAHCVSQSVLLPNVTHMNRTTQQPRAKALGLHLRYFNRKIPL